MSVSDSRHLMTELLSSFVCVCVLHMCPFLTSRQLLLPCSAGSMTSSRTTTPATIRRRPSRRQRGARQSTTVEDCWGARWARLLWMNTGPPYNHFSVFVWMNVLDPESSCICTQTVSLYWQQCHNLYQLLCSVLTTQAFWLVTVGKAQV